MRGLCGEFESARDVLVLINPIPLLALSPQPSVLGLAEQLSVKKYLKRVLNSTSICPGCHRAFALPLIQECWTQFAVPVSVWSCRSGAVSLQLSCSLW